MVSKVLTEGARWAASVLHRESERRGAPRPGGEKGMDGGRDREGGRRAERRKRGIEASRARFASLRARCFAGS